MPQATFKGIFGVSSEDPNFPALSLLKINAGKKWKGGEAGLSSVYVILQLEKASQITGVDIGNEHSAFVEVLVGKNGSDEFKEILITCSFMSPIESKNSSNPNRVRCFTKSALVESIASQKWDLVKIVCTQPFNKHVQYGLSFIKLHITEEEKPKVKKSLVPEKFLNQKPTESKDGPSKLFAGKFKLRDDSTDSESDTAMGLFNRWKSKKSNPDQQSTAVSIREASKKPELVKDSFTPKQAKLVPSSSSSSKRRSLDKKEEGEDAEKLKVLDRNRMDLLFGDEDDAPNEKFEKKLQKDKERREKEREDMKTPSGSKRLSTSGLESNTAKKIKYDEDDKNAPKTPKDKKDKLEKEKHEKDKKKRDESTPRTSKKMSSENKKYDSPKPPKKVETPRSQKKLDENENKRPTVYKPFNKLLEGVTIVISGIQNPDRANLRTMALAMGAKYKGDWDNSCTHLICAYKNTPKYNQVKTLGKIVKRHWVEKCHQLKKKLPWRRYALDDKEAEKPESDDEVLDESFKPTSSVERSPGKDKTLALYDEDSNHNANVISSGEDTEDELERVRGKAKPMDVSVVLSDDEEPPKKNKTSPRKKNISMVLSDDDEDHKSKRETSPKKKKYSPKEKKAPKKSVSTDEEAEPPTKNKTSPKKKNISMVLSDDDEDHKSKRETSPKKKKYSPKKSVSSDEEAEPTPKDCYDLTTDEEEFTIARRGIFSGKKVFLSSNLGAVDRMKLSNLLEEHKALISKNDSSSNIIVSTKNENKVPVDYVKPQWVYESVDMKCLLPTKRYLV